MNALNLPRFRTWISSFVLLLGLTLGMVFVSYFGYCWGWWGKHSLLLQSLFQCNCPSGSEKWRYPRQVEIIAPGCSYVGSILSPTGNVLYVMEGKSKFAKTFSSTYLLDFRTNQKTPFFIGKGSNYFLTDNLLFLSLEYGHTEYEGGKYILDRTTRKQYPIQSFVFLRKDDYINGEPNLEILASELRNTSDVYLINNDTIVALKLDFESFPEHSFYIDETSLPTYDPDRAQQFLLQNHINYHAVPGLYQEQALSPDGRLIAREDGIYLTESGEKIVEGYTVRGINGKYFSVRGWVSDSSGVIYYKFLDGCLLELPSLDGGECTISVSQPLIKLKVPEEYLK